LIVSEDTVHKAVQYLAIDPHPLGLAKKDLFDAESRFKRVRAAVYLEQTGTVGEREARCELDPRVERANAEVGEAAAVVDRHRERRDAAKFIWETWKEEGNNIRAAERVR
jgi:hypothetical protein